MPEQKASSWEEVFDSITESQNGLNGKEPQRLYSSNPTPQAGLPTTKLSTKLKQGMIVI